MSLLRFRVRAHGHLLRIHLRGTRWDLTKDQALALVAALDRP